MNKVLPPLDERALWLRVADIYYHLRQLAYAHIGQDGRVRYHSADFAYFIERDPQKIVGRAITDIFLPLVGAEPILAQILAGDIVEYRLQQVSTQRQDGDLLYFHLVLALATPLLPQDGVILILENATSTVTLEQQVVQQRNELELLTTQLAHLNASLHLQAKTDALTGLANRRYFNEILAQTLTATLTNQRTTGLILLDMDGFKKVNDRFGHTAGDGLLKLLGQVIQRHLRNRDTAARFGGDEFALILPDVDVAGARTVASRIQLELMATIAQEPSLSQLPDVGVTLGVAVAPMHATTPAALLHAADMALYAAKRNGKNQVGVYTPVIGA